jgi:pheromone shutdown protein TraB
MNPTSPKSPASEILGTKFDHSQDEAKARTEESERLKCRAENLTIVAFFTLAIGFFCLVFPIVNPAADGGSDAGWFWFSGVLSSTAVLFFFFAQLFHIRSLLSKPRAL